MTAQDIEDSSKEMPMDLPKEISKELSQEVRSVSLEESAPIAGSRQVESGKPTSWKKYPTYALEVDGEADDRATEIIMFNFERPHMRAFHFAWITFFAAFFIWFAISPLLGEIRSTLELTQSQVWLSSISAVAGTILLRLTMGPICDKYGSRIPMGLCLCLTSIPLACTGFVNSANGLIALRFFIGLAGSTFVMCQFWTSRMFAKDIVGSANAIVAGWGNLGGGITQVIMGSVLFPLFKTGMSPEMAWRTVCIVPALLGFVVGVLCILYSDDCPKGNYSELKKRGEMVNVSASSTFRLAALDLNTWLLFVQYACCFGVELTMNNAASLYFIDTFEMTTEKAGAIASLFGWMNLFARGLGGYFSDLANERMGFKGRIFGQTICLFCQGAMVIAFAFTKNLGLSIFVLVIFSCFVQAAEGTTFAIVPYVNPPCTGAIVGIVGAGGNVGAVAFGLAFLDGSYTRGYTIMGAAAIASSFLSGLLRIDGDIIR